MRYLTTFILFFTLTFTGVAMASNGGDDSARTIEIIGTDNLKFDVTAIEAAPGEQITIRYTTESEMPKMAMAHNVVVIDKDADVDKVAMASMQAADNEYISPDHKESIVAATALAGGGETVEVTFTVPKAPGEYPYICTFPGHYMAGMKGVLTVK